MFRKTRQIWVSNFEKQDIGIKVETNFGTTWSVCNFVSQNINLEQIPNPG